MKSEELWYKFVCRRNKQDKENEKPPSGAYFSYVTDGGLMFDTVLKF